MNDNELRFRTAAFGGFQKQDVLNYLESSAKDHGEKMEAVQKELEETRTQRGEAEEKAAALEKEVDVLRAENQRLAADLAQREEALAALEKAKGELEEKVAQLQKLMEELTPAATAYEGIKDRTAGIELEAHGRAQAIEREARERVRKSLTQVEEWFSKMEAAYGRLRTDMEATLSHAAGEMERVSQSLSTVSGEFSSHDDALKALAAQVKALEPPQVPDPLPVEPGES